MTRTESAEIRLTRPSHLRYSAALLMWLSAVMLAMAWLKHAGRAGAILAPLCVTMFLAAVWTTWAREEWTAERGRLVHRIRFGPWIRQEAFENATLAVTHTVSTEDQYLYRLVVRVPDRSRVFESSVRDENRLVQSGAWLEGVTGFPFTRAG